MDHENKPHAAVGFPPQSYIEYNKKGRKFFYVGTNIFRGFFEENVSKAASVFPLNFGNDNAMSVIHAINKVRPVFTRTKDVVRILQNECFAVIHEDKQTGGNDHLIRLDLFRRLDRKPHHKRKYDFTGGIMHALKHFSINGTPLSTSRETNDIPYALRIVEILIDSSLGNSSKISANALMPV